MSNSSPTTSTLSPSNTSMVIDDNALPFSIDEEVEYKGDRGYIAFICAQSLSLCVSSRTIPKSRQVRVVVPVYDWDKVTPLEQ